MGFETVSEVSQHHDGRMGGFVDLGTGAQSHHDLARCFEDVRANIALSEMLVDMRPGHGVESTQRVGRDLVLDVLMSHHVLPARTAASRY